MTATRGRRRALLVAVVGAVLAGCSSGPSQEQRIADAITANDTVTAYAGQIPARLQATFPDLDLTSDPAGPPNTGRWRPCSDEPYNDHYDSPDGSSWINGDVYTLEPRLPTTPVIEPLAQTYLDQGWVLVRDDLDAAIPELKLRKDGFYLTISGADQAYLDRHPDFSAMLWVLFSSPCLHSPDNLTEWDPAHPHDFDLARTDE